MKNSIWHWIIIFSLKKEALLWEKPPNVYLLTGNFKYLLTLGWLWSRIQSENFLISSLSPPCLTPLLSISHLATIFQVPFFWPPWLFIYLQSSQPVLTSVPSRPLFFLTCPFYSVYPSLNLLSYLSLFHSWLNPFSSPSLVFPLPSNLSTFISIFHSFTVGYIFSYSFFLCLCRLP